MPEDYTALFEKHRDSLSEKACSSVSYARENAAVALEATGLPTNRLEYWKYSRIGKVFKGIQINIAYNDVSVAEKLPLSPDGQYEISSLKGAIDAKHPEIEKHLTKYAGFKNEGLTALNTAFFSDGVFINVPDNTIVSEPIRLPEPEINNDGNLNQPRHLIVVGRNSSVTVITGSEPVAGEGVLTNTVEEIIIGENAEVKQYVLQNDGRSKVTSAYVHQEKDSRYTRVTVTLDGTFIRNNINVNMDATGCESNLYGYYNIREKNQIDNHTLIEHKKPDCVSNELYVGLLDDEASGIFNGRVLVHQDAQRTNAFQSNKNILLSDNATMNTKPELEIYADDVKCSHGATIGQVDPEALFYLQSRGIPKQKALSMLLQSFSIAVTDKITDESFRDEVVELILTQLDLVN